MKKALVLMVMAVLLAGCATVEVKDVTGQDKPDGIVFYLPDLYLLVTKGVKDAKSGEQQATQEGYTYTFMQLPNMSKKYAAKHVPGFGSATMKITLVDGWKLSSADQESSLAVGDVLPVTGSADLTKGVRGIVPVAPAPEQRPLLEVGLYRLDFDEKTGQFSKFTKVFPQ